jgi:hypothetical protein
VGLPDEVDCKNQEYPIVVERKYVSRFPASPWLDHCVQTCVYIMGLVALGFSQTYGVVSYHSGDSERRFEIRLDKRLEEKVRSAACEVPSILRRETEPKATANPNKCRVCEYRVICKWRADQKNYCPPYFLDIETDLSGTLIWAITVYSSRDVRLKQFFADEPAQEKQILTEFISLVEDDGEGAILTYSGSDYDRRVLINRLKKYGLSTPDRFRFKDMCSPLKHAGLKGGLERIAAPFYRLRHPELKRGAAWFIYRDFMHSKKSELKQERRMKLLEYNADDVIALLKVCINRPELFETSQVRESQDDEHIRYLSEMYYRIGSTIRRNRPDRRHDIEVRFRSSSLTDLHRIIEALKSCGFKARIGPDKRRYAARLYGSWAHEFLIRIGQGNEPS